MNYELHSSEQQHLYLVISCSRLRNTYCLAYVMRVLYLLHFHLLYKHAPTAPTVRLYSRNKVGLACSLSTNERWDDVLRVCRISTLPSWVVVVFEACRIWGLSEEVPISRRFRRGDKLWAWLLHAPALAPTVRGGASRRHWQAVRALGITTVGPTVCPTVETSAYTTVGTAVDTPENAAEGTAVDTAVDTTVDITVGPAIDTAVGVVVDTSVRTAVDTLRQALQ